jgi:hypothetical protein
MTDGAQTNPLTLYFDRAMISGSYIGPPAGSATTNQPPSVLLLDPTAGAAFDRQLYMEASASDDAGVAKVVFQVDGKAVATDTAAPYAYTWAVPRKLAYGGHTVTAVAYDSAGLTTASAPVSVTRAR